MRNIRKEAYVWLQILAFACIWSALLLVEGGLKIDGEAFKKLPEVVTIYSIMVYLFKHWIWKWRLLRGWLIPFPNLQGTWTGTLQSSWIDPNTGLGIGPTPVTLAIRQGFDAISCSIYTAESESYSVSAQINQDEDSGALHLDYSYTNRPKLGLRDRSAIHDGAATFRIITVPNLLLEGEYWTSRKTTGEMRFLFVDKSVAQSFVKATDKVIL